MAGAVDLSFSNDLGIPRATLDNNFTDAIRFKAALRTGGLLHIPLGKLHAVPDQTWLRTGEYIIDGEMKAIGVKRIQLMMQCLDATQAMHQLSQLYPMAVLVKGLDVTKYDAGVRPMEADDFINDFNNFNLRNYKQLSTETGVDIWDHNFRANGVRTWVTATSTRGVAEPVQQYLRRWYDTLVTQVNEMYEAHDRDDLLATGPQVYGCWLQVVLPYRGGADFEFDVDISSEFTAQALERLQTPRVVYSPPVQQGCFWHCITRASTNSSTTLSTGLVKSTYDNYAARFGWQQVDDYFNYAPLELFFIQQVSTYLQKDITVVGLDREIILQTNPLKPMTDNLKQDHLILLFYVQGDQGHWCLVRNWIGMYPTYDCPNKYCNTTITATSTRLTQVMTKHFKRCLKCACQKEPFPSLEAYYHHVENASTECAAYQASETGGGAFKREFLKPRDLPDYPEDKMEDRHYSFDIECGIPFAPEGMYQTAATAQGHWPYAAGWYGTKVITDVRHAEERDQIKQVPLDEIHIAYGEDCLDRFLDWVHSVIELDVKPTAFERLLTRLEFVNEEKNLRNKIRKNCKAYFNYKDEFECPTCNAGFPSADDVITHMTGAPGEQAEITMCGKQWWANRQLKHMMNPKNNGNKRSLLPRYFVYAHNGSGYDYEFLMSAIRRSPHFTSKDFDFLINDTSRVLQLNINNTFIFRDTANILKGSLDGIGRKFGVTTTKGEFPYKAVTRENLYGVISRESGDIKPSHLMKVHKIESNIKAKQPSTPEEMDEFWADWPEGFDVQQATDLYLRRDVAVLHEITMCAMLSFKETLNFPFTEMMTTAGGAFKIFQTFFLDEDVYPILHPEENAKAREAYAGGRCEVFERFLTNEDRAAIANEEAAYGYEDCNSMYPAAQKRYMPVGHPTHIGPRDYPFIRDKVLGDHLGQWEEKTYEEMDELRHHLHDHHAFPWGDEYVTIMWCDFDPPQDTSVIPVVPERLDGKTMFTLYPRDDAPVCHPELMKMLEFGYFIRRIRYIMRFEKGQPFDNYVDTLAALKVAATNEADRMTNKLFMNSLYGRLAMMLKMKTFLSDNTVDVRKALNDNSYTTRVLPFSREERNGTVEEWVLVCQDPKVADNPRSNLPMAAFVTSHSRCMLIEHLQALKQLPSVNPHVESVREFYCDTDSWQYFIKFRSPQSMIEAYNGEGVLIGMEQQMHAKRLGAWKDEFEGMSKVVDAACVAPKFYITKHADGAEKATVKGVKLMENGNLRPGQACTERVGSLVFAQGLNIDTVRKLLTGAIDYVKTLNELWVTNQLRSVATLTVMRTLSATYSKRVIVPGTGRTRPYLHTDQPNEKRVCEPYVPEECEDVFMSLDEEEDQCLLAAMADAEESREEFKTEEDLVNELYNEYCMEEPNPTVELEWEMIQRMN